MPGEPFETRRRLQRLSLVEAKDAAVGVDRVEGGGRRFLALGFGQVVLFMVLLLAGYVYVWRNGALDWGNEKV